MPLSCSGAVSHGLCQQDSAHLPCSIAQITFAYILFFIAGDPLEHIAICFEAGYSQKPCSENCEAIPHNFLCKMKSFTGSGGDYVGSPEWIKK